MIKTHASLFSGIGAAEIAADWMGWQNAFHCEIQEFPRRVLEYWYPNATSYEDITKTDFTQWRGKIDILTAGFPCQPFSCAGQRRGADDDRYLWPEALRAVCEILPSWFVGENVAGLLSMVQPGEEAKVGRTDALFEEDYIYRKEQRFTLDEICEGLERAGYAVQPFVVPACAVGAPHRRDRLWIVARLAADAEGQQGERHGLEQRGPCQPQQGEPGGGGGEDCHGLPADRWRGFPTQPPVCRGDDGLPGRLAGITFPRWRAEAIKALGNAMVPAVVYEIFRAIAQVENEKHQTT